MDLLHRSYFNSTLLPGFEEGPTPILVSFYELPTVKGIAECEQDSVKIGPKVRPSKLVRKNNILPLLMTGGPAPMALVA